MDSHSHSQKLLEYIYIEPHSNASWQLTPYLAPIDKNRKKAVINLRHANAATHGET